jgi:hypothetical protein
MDRIKTRMHFEKLRRGPNETALKFKDRFKNALDAMEQLGEDTGITDVTLSQAYSAPRNNTNLDPTKHTTILVELENRVTKGNDMHPTTLLKAHNLAQKWKTT